MITRHPSVLCARPRNRRARGEFCLDYPTYVVAPGTAACRLGHDVARVLGDLRLGLGGDICRHARLDEQHQRGFGIAPGDVAEQSIDRFAERLGPFQILHSPMKALSLPMSAKDRFFRSC